jgi:hypothetical protein
MRRVLLPFADGTMALPAGQQRVMPVATTPGRDGRRRLLGVQANTLFPIGLMALPDPAAPSDLPQSLPTDAGPSLAAFRLLQGLIADPDSAESRHFVRAMIEAATSNPAPADAAGSVLPGFPDIHLDRLALVLGYLAAWPTAWADFQDAFRYGLYAAADDAATPTGVLLGHIAFERAAETTMTPTTLYRITYTALGGIPVALHYMQGMLIAPSGAAMPDLSLKATYLQPDTAGEFAPAFVGQLGDRRVVALASPANDPPPLLGNSEGGDDPHGLAGAWLKTKGWFDQTDHALEVGIPVFIAVSLFLGWNIKCCVYNRRLTPGIRDARDACIAQGFDGAPFERLNNAIATEGGGNPERTRYLAEAVIGSTDFKIRCQGYKTLFGKWWSEKVVPWFRAFPHRPQIPEQVQDELQHDIEEFDSDSEDLNTIIEEDGADEAAEDVLRSMQQAGNYMTRMIRSVDTLSERMELFDEEEQLEGQLQFGSDQADYEIYDSLDEDSDNSGTTDISI